MERRSLPRKVINHPVWVICCDVEDNQDDQCLAYALDINESGILIESSVPLRGHRIKILASSPKNKIVEIVGSIVYTDSSVKGRFKAGVRFIGSQEENLLFSEKLIEAAHCLEADRERFVNTILT